MVPRKLARLRRGCKHHVPQCCATSRPHFRGYLALSQIVSRNASEILSAGFWFRLDLNFRLNISVTASQPTSCRPRQRSLPWRGTNSSNPSPSSGESIKPRRYKKRPERSRETPPQENEDGAKRHAIEADGTKGPPLRSRIGAPL